jgi:uncharacterized lipoprotein YddW (UPF0748 family)
MIYPKHVVGAGLAVCLATAGCTSTELSGGGGGLAVLFGGGKGGVSPIVRKGPMRAVWVTRFDYRTPADIREIMENCHSVGLNAVLFQVRGNGTALYRSRIEPWADELGGADGGFDPLEVAVKEGHARGIEVHAWVNVMPAWRGPNPPSNPRQLYNAHPEWFWYDQKGQRQPLIQMNEGRREGWYVSLNPCLPEVRKYLVSVFEEIVRGYPIDGLHLDYIRFPNETAPRGVDYPYDPKTLALYKAATGRVPKESREIWTQWRAEQVSRLVYETRVMMRCVHPQMKLSAAVGPDPVQAKAAHYQDGETWAAKDWVDFLVPMNYTGDEATYVRRAEAWRRCAHGKGVVMGIGLHSAGSPRGTIRQLELADHWNQGFSLFSYSSLFGSTARTGPAETGTAATTQRQERLAAVRRTLLQMAER